MLKLDGLSLQMKREAFAKQMADRLGKKLVNVVMVQDPRRYKRQQEGKSGIIEFLSIKDAHDSMLAFNAGRIAGYEKTRVAWWNDPCERRVEKCQWCTCMRCTKT